MRTNYGIIGVIILILLIISGVWFGVNYYKKQKKSFVSTPTATSTDLTSQQFREEIKAIIKTDSDLDGVSDEEEKRIGTNADNPDTDGDGLLDGDEVRLYHSDPLKSDTDGDGITDGKAVRMNKNPLTGKSLVSPVKVGTTTVK
jgi:FtsZ-interacting cell division protein ZipA